jgi:hypothetical protein
MLMALWIMWNDVLMHFVSGSARRDGVQLVRIGTHWKRAAKKTATAWPITMPMMLQMTMKMLF